MTDHDALTSISDASSGASSAGTNPSGASYRDKLQLWATVRLLPNMQRITIGRFRKRSDAEGYIRYLQLRIPDAKFVIIFDHP